MDWILEDILKVLLILLVAIIVLWLYRRTSLFFKEMPAEVFRVKYLGAGNSLAVQWLACHTFTAKGAGSIQELRSQQAARHGKTNKQTKKKNLDVYLQFNCTWLRGKRKKKARVKINKAKW